MREITDGIVPSFVMKICAAELEQLAKTGGGVAVATLATVDGFDVASAGNYIFSDATRLAAVTSSLHALGDAAIDELGLGAMLSVTVEGERGRMVALGLRLPQISLVLTVVAEREALLAHTLLATRFAASQILAKVTQTTINR